MQSSAFGISDEDRLTLTSWTRSSSVSAGHAERAAIVLACAEGAGTSETARRLGVSRPTVIKWRDRFATQGIAGLDDEPRSVGRAEVHLVVPKSFNDAQQVADRFKASVPVIINLQTAEVDLSKRLIDFASGLTYALDGGMQRVADKVFLLTPADVEVSAEERAALLEKGFFNQY